MNSNTNPQSTEPLKSSAQLVCELLTAESMIDGAPIAKTFPEEPADDIFSRIERALQGDPKDAKTTHEFIALVDAPDPEITYKPKPFPREIFVDDNQFDPFCKPRRYADFTTENIKAIVDFALVELVTPAELEKLQDLQRKFTAVSDEMRNWSNQKASAEFHRQNRRHIDETVATENIKLQAPNRTHENIYSEFTAKRQGLTELQIKYSQEAWPILGKIFRIIFECVRERMIILEINEREHAEAYSIPWVPSHLYRICAAFQIRHHPKRLCEVKNTPVSPMSVLNGIVNL